MILINTQNIKQNLNQRVGLYNPQELVEILLTLPWKNPALQQAAALGVCFYCSRQRVKEYSLVAQPGNAACKANPAAQGREKGWGKQRMGDGRVQRDQPPCLPGEGPWDTVSQGSSWACVLSDLPMASSSWSAHLLWHFCLPRARCRLASTADHLLENVCLKTVRLFLHAGYTSASAPPSFPFWRARGRHAHISFVPFNQLLKFYSKTTGPFL